MPTSERFLFSITNRQFYETLSNYKADESHFANVARKCITEGWTLKRGDAWVHCEPKNAFHPPQGWKMHISAALPEAKAILRTAAPILVRRNIPFKFAADGHLLRLMTSKQWPRGKAGKFMTAYPANEEQFVSLMKEMDAALTGYHGPYILSDTRYKNNPILYYRYGSLSERRSLMANGLSLPVIIAPDGTPYSDERRPYSNNPHWAKDPFSANPPAEGQPLLKNGRYLVTAPLAFSTSGGVYKAFDNETKQTVVIKEARPLTHVQNSGADAVTLLKKEHRLLTLLSGTGIAPEAIDFFNEWEHSFLVEEFFDGEPLRYYASTRSLALRTRASVGDAKKYHEWFCTTYSNVAKLFEVLHERDIVFCDVSHYNVLVQPSSGDIRLIDFEGAYEVGVDEPTPLFTPGFAPAANADGQFAQKEDDYYGLGALMLAGLMPINALIYVKPEAHAVFGNALVRDLGLPQSVQQVIFGLMARDRKDRMTPARARAVLSEPATVAAPANACIEADSLDEGYLDLIANYLLSVATYDRQDRLFPADPTIFSTNPLSIAYGACGVAYALKKIKGHVPEPVLQWMDSQTVLPERYPPGLYLGLSGLAWVSLELGLTQRAKELAHMAMDHPLVLDGPDLFYGAAGCGLTALKFFLATRDEAFLAEARKMGHHLLDTAAHDSTGSFWMSQGKIFYGLGHGASGVSLFLLYLYLFTGDELFLNTGTAGLDYELAHAVRTTDGGLSWTINEGHPTITPYYRYGSSGVGMTLLRYWKITGEQRYYDELERIIVDADRKYAIFPGRSFGMSGIGELFLDLAQLTGNQQYIASARKVAAGTMLFAIDTPEGIAFPGEELMRISCDYATGSAGVAIFLERLLRGSRASFMLDEIFETICPPSKAQESLGYVTQ